MNNLIGISVSILPFNLDAFIGTLLYQEFPVTSVYASDENSPIVKEWLDCDDDTDRFFIYEVTASNLSQFVNGKLSHYDLFNSANNGVGFLIDEKDNEIIKINAISPDKLSNDYLPSYDSYFNINNGVDTEKINTHFDLGNIRIESENEDDILRNIAKERKAEVFNLHYKKGVGVGYGRIDTQIFGETILSFDDLYKEMALDSHFGKNRGDRKLTQKNKETILGVASTELIIKKAASFSAFLKPRYDSQVDLFVNKTETEQITINMFELFELSSNEILLSENYINYSDFVFKALKKFLHKVTSYDVNLELKWTNQKGTTFLKKEFSLYTANNTINYIDSIHKENTEDFKVKGKFSAINCKTAHFTFYSLEDENFTGYFDKLIRDGLYLLNFTSIYEVTIERNTIKDAGKLEASISDKILAYYLIDS
jgi:hypothetical protein